MVVLDRKYQYTGVNPAIKGKIGSVTEVVDENFVIFVVWEYSQEEGTVLIGYRVKFASLKLAE